MLLKKLFAIIRRKQKPVKFRYVVDLETLGIKPGSVVWSIGVAKMDNEKIVDKFYRVISIRDCEEKWNLTSDKSTVKWWDEQSELARRELAAAKGHSAVTLHQALRELELWMNKSGKDSIDAVFGNGPEFDNVHLDHLFGLVGIKLPWSHRANQSVRTVKYYLPEVEVPFEGIKHHACDDAINEAEYILAAEKASRCPFRIVKRLFTGKW